MRGREGVRLGRKGNKEGRGHGSILRLISFTFTILKLPASSFGENKLDIQKTLAHLLLTYERVTMVDVADVWAAGAKKFYCSCFPETGERRESSRRQGRKGGRQGRGGAAVVPHAVAGNGKAGC